MRFTPTLANLGIIIAYHDDYCYHYYHYCYCYYMLLLYYMYILFYIVRTMYHISYSNDYYCPHVVGSFGYCTINQYHVLIIALMP